ncbi:autotransporter domain-containing protein [Proteus mirabilis]|uniref:autotransporter domain-containing protein n=2 Tax=Proteus mirabilis TaxID=584 RepID=UPI001EF99570|nr:autotransporter domain-containing protein [Proteus mirabilis]MCL9988978.1 autotransporter domain-containing protein [Proteus mirabilis]MCT8217668.1 autotransporter domain-containing protein [Proteus mirabilis]MDC5899491.1 autotransporter domain-containing protein [Proteus mirabilis]MDC5902971.1 autotransporter domain-containing protein [Proteus mirabilis]MDC5920627.1 autotransporter domain-containing protein [Proteus mirabilis]
MGDSIYNPFSIANNASQYYEFNHNRYEYIKHLHGRVLDKHSYNQQLMTPFGSTYIYATISDDTLSLYNRIADEGERNIQKKIPNYNVRETVYFSEELLPNELFISIDGGKTIKKINKENNPQLDLLYLSHISKNSKTVVGYAFAGARARLEQMVKNNSIFEDTIGCGTYNGCYVFAYNVYNNTFSILDRNMEIRYLTKDGNFILYEYKGDERKKLYIYDIYKKEDFELTFDNVNKYLANHPEKAILLSPITEYPFLKGIKRRGVDIQKISDNGQVFIGQLNRDLPKKKLLDREYPKVAFITTASGPIRELSLSEFGSTKLADTSADGNYSVGWGDVWHYNYAIKLPTRTKTSSAIFSQALLYDFSNDKLINIGNLSKKEEEARFRNARALDITADGKYVVGWSETDEYNLKTIPKDLTGTGPHAFIMFHRHGFIYFNNHMYDLGTLDGGKDSEAHAISDDGRIIYGVATNERNNWRQVIWRNDEIDNKYFNTEQQEIADEKDKQAEQEKTEQERLARLQAEQEKAEQERLAKLQAEQKKAEQERLAKLQAEQEKAKQERLARLQAEQEKAEQERLARLQAEQEKAEQERLARLQAEQEKAEQERLARLQAEQEKAEQERLAKLQAEQKKAEQERLAKLQAEQKKAEQERLAKLQAEQEKAKQEKAEQEKAEQERLAKLQAEQEKAEQERLAKLQAEQEKAEQERLARLQAEQEKTEQERLARLQAEQEKAEQERLARLQAEQEKTEQERLARLQADKELPPVEDEQVQQAKAKVKEKETAKSSTAISKPIDVENSYKSMQLMAENSYKLIDMQQGQLRYLASATCSVGTEKACLSGFTHYQNIDKANAIQTGISGAYRFDINQTPLVVGLAIDSDSYSSLPTGYEYQGYPLPLIGFSVDLIPSLNPTSNGNALHLSLKGAYVNRKVTIKRPILDNTEAGKGHAKISGYYIDFQGYYPYTLNNLITVTPFAGLTFNQTSRSAYSETQGTKLAVHYQELNAHSLLAKIGLGIEYTVNAKLKLDSKAGLLWHLSHHQGDFQSHIDYLGQQKINYNDNKKQLAQRPFASVGLTYQLDKQSSVNTTTNWQMTPYRNQDIHMGIGYTYRF